MPNEKLDEESGLPKATIDKLVHDLTPENYTVSKETRGLLRELAHKFLQIITTDANEKCEAEKKKTISVQHIYKAFQNYGCGNFIDECDVAAKNYDDYSKHKPSRQNKLNQSGMTTEELDMLQKKLFKEAKEQQAEAYEIETNNSDEEE